MELVGIDDIRAAAKRIDGTVQRTTLLPANWAAPDRPLWIKPEGFQAVGAFKVRGAANALARLDESARANGVVAYSSGNHAQAVAHAARAAGLPAVIVIDDTAPPTKIEATRALGAEVVLVPLAQRQGVAEDLARTRGAALIPPFDHPDVIAGQGTIGLEIAEDLPDVELVLIPVSGGGLAAGIAVAIKALCPNATVFGVEPELAGDAAASYAAGHLVRWPSTERVRTIADGLRAEPSELTFAHLRTLLDGILTVSEDEIRAAMRQLAHGSGLVAEPAGAVATAAYLYRQDDLPAGRTVAVLSGRNVDKDLFAEVMRS
ncbi:MAG TPA: threonine/serine dehydratase [Pseudonocardiaceae bacterium]|jgi:threonine dehydratase|nr:threonine/serine dehydratase [Pseudonocardiaceae bacterium]